MFHQYLFKLNQNTVTQINQILGYDSFLWIPQFDDHFVLVFLFTNSNTITIAPLTHDHKLCSLVNAKHYNGTPVKDFKIQHIREHFSIQADDLNKVPKLMQLFQDAQNNMMRNYSVNPTPNITNVLKEAKLCEKLVTKTGDLNLTHVGRATDAYEIKYNFNNAMRRAEYPTLHRRFDVNDHGFIGSYYVKKSDDLVNNKTQELNYVYTYHDELIKRLQTRVLTHSVSYPVGVAHPISGSIKLHWNYQTKDSLELVNIIKKIK